MTWRRNPFEDIWKEMTRDFWEFDKSLEKMWEEIEKDPNTRTWYYGYQMNVGPDGKPQIKEFGNVKPRGGRLLVGSREPLVDVSIDDKEGTVKLVAEMPGADKESIKVNATDDHVQISANNGGKPYNAEVPLNVEVDPNSADASYTNGILQVIFKRKSPAASKGVNVKVR